MAQPPFASLVTKPASTNMNGAQYNGKIILVSVSLLCFVALFILALHIYAKWIWRRSTRRQQQALWRQQQALWRRSRALHLHNQEPMSVGLDKAIVDSFPIFIYKVPQIFPLEGAMECAVCLSEFQENDKGRVLPKCNHSFHTECIDMWFRSHTTCPLCRTNADSSETRVSAPSPSTGASAEETDMSAASYSAAPQTTVNDDANAHLGFEAAATEGANGESLPSPGWRWRMSTSDRFSQNENSGVQFPTNVLYWGNNSHVSSHTSPLQVPGPRMEHGQRGARSLPHMAIEIPRRSMHYLMAGRCASSGASLATQTSQPQSKAPGAGLNVFKRLLSRERRVFPTEQEMGMSGHGGMGTSNGATVSGS